MHSNAILRKLLEVQYLSSSPNSSLEISSRNFVSGQVEILYFVESKLLLYILSLKIEINIRHLQLVEERSLVNLFRTCILSKSVLNMKSQKPYLAPIC